MATILEQINTDLKAAMLAKDEIKKSILRVLIGELNRIDKKAYTDEKALSVIKKMVENAKVVLTSTDLLKAHVVYSELAVLESYLPKQLTKDQLHMIISQLIEDKGYNGTMYRGKIMADLKAGYNGQYDGKLASDIISEIFKIELLNC